MTKSTRTLLSIVAGLVVLVVIVVSAIPLFLNTDSFRTRIESTLSTTLGRKVTIQKVQLSVWSGGLVAQNAEVADDPRFSNQPFIHADSVKIGVELLPLIFSRELHIRSFELQSPNVQLLRSANGTWNYSTIGNSFTKSAAPNPSTKQAFPSLTVGKVDISNGRITVGPGPDASGKPGATKRVYEQVNLSVKDFGFSSSFPFSASAKLPADGSVSIQGNAGPINPTDASMTPFSGHLELKHIDPLAAGFVDSADGITGLLEGLVLDASWSGQQLHVTKLLVDTPHLTIARSNSPKQPKPKDLNAEGASMLENLSVDSAQIKNGTVTLTTAGQTGPPAVYQQVNAQITNLTPKTVSPFSASAQLPGGGSLSAQGNAGPFNQQNNAATPLDAQVSLKHVELASSGVLPADAGISGLTDLQAHIKSNGQTLNAQGTATVANAKLAKDGTPSAKPIHAQFNLAQNEQAMTGQLQQGAITIGRAVINLNGAYQSSGATTAINLKVIGNGVPIDELVAFLPAVGVHLPSGSQLRGGTLTTSLTVSGSTASPTISGPVRLDNTQLAGFNLGAKLATLSQLTGGRIGSATGNGTNIRSLSMVVQEQGGAIRTENIALNVAGVGTATGAGSVSAGGALDYNMLLKLTELIGAGGNAAAGATPQRGGAGGLMGLAGGLTGMIPGGAAGGALGGIAGSALRNGIPVRIGGTTSNPSFAPNLSGVMTSVGAGAAQNLLKGKSGSTLPANKLPNNIPNPLKNGLGGLFGKH